MDKYVLNIASSISDIKISMLDELNKFINKKGLRPASRVLKVSHGTLSQYQKGKSISIEKLSEYILIIHEWESNQTDT